MASAMQGAVQFFVTFRSCQDAHVLGRKQINLYESLGAAGFCGAALAERPARLTSLCIEVQRGSCSL